MLEHLTLRPQPVGHPLQATLDAFLLSRQAMRCTPKTLTHYTYTVGGFVERLQGQGVRDPQSITPHHVRAYLVSLQRRGLKDTTQHAHARGIKTWLRWLVEEGDLDDNPMRRVAMPRLEARIPAPFSPDNVRALLAACDRQTPIGARNYAICLTLLDSGLRAAELVSLRIGDVDMRSGLCVVMGKGAKMRQVRVGAKARGAVVRMLGYRQDAANGAALWMGYTGQGTETGTALSIHGLQTLLHRLGKQAGVMPCAPHRFRRTFALWCLRDGMDLHSLRMLMGHSSLAVLQRYLALAGEDIERAHIAHSPVDNLL
jgi:site-specific recombinase XerD